MTNLAVVDIDPRNHERDAAILDGARRLIRKEGLDQLRRAKLAHYAGISPTSVNNFGRTSLSSTTADPADGGYRSRILKVLMKQAVTDRDIVLIGAGLVDGCLSADELDGELRAIMGV